MCRLHRSVCRGCQQQANRATDDYLAWPRRVRHGLSGESGAGARVHGRSAVGLCETSIEFPSPAAFTDRRAFFVGCRTRRCRAPAFQTSFWRVVPTGRRPRSATPCGLAIRRSGAGIERRPVPDTNIDDTRHARGRPAPWPAARGPTVRGRIGRVLIPETAGRSWRRSVNFPTAAAFESICEEWNEKES